MYQCLALLSLICLLGCQVRSGSYIKLKKKQTARQIAGRFETRPELIKGLNKEKSEFGAGDWVFVPHSHGVLNVFGDVNDKYVRTARASEVPEGEFIWPIPSSTTITSKFGKRRGRPHQGIDIYAHTGAHILAVADGVVVHSDNRIRGYGHLVVLKHKNGLFSVYAHCSKRLVKVGDKVDQGDVIAKVGSSGRSTGPHLHFEVRVGEQPVNPLKYISPGPELASNSR